MGTIYLATSKKVSLLLSSFRSTFGHESGINRPPSSARPCIKTSSNDFDLSFPRVL